MPQMLRRHLSITPSNHPNLITLMMIYNNDDDDDFEEKNYDVGHLPLPRLHHLLLLLPLLHLAANIVKKVFC